jgi:hypothetical protein
MTVTPADARAVADERRLLTDLVDHRRRFVGGAII